MEDVAHLVGIGRAAGGAVALQLGLVQPDEVFALVARAVERAIDMHRCPSLNRGDDEAAVEAPVVASIRAATDVCPLPGLGGITGLGIAAEHAQTARCRVQRPVGGVGIGADDDAVLGMEHRDAGQAGDIVNVVIAVPRRDLRPPVMTIAAQRDAGVGPVTADAPDQAADIAHRLRPRRRLPVFISIATGRVVSQP